MTDLAVTGEIVRSTPLESGEMHVLVKFPVMENPQGLARVCLEGMPVCVVPMNHHPADFGPQAQALYRSRFFETRDLYYFIGSDAQYQKWCKEPNKCTHTGRQGSAGDGIQYCHFRSSAICGTGIKPDFSGIPMLRSSHGLQTDQGYSAVGGKEWFRTEAAKSVKKWAWETLKKKLGYSHWNQVPPKVLFDWASDMGVDSYLPKAYKESGELNG